MRYLEIPPHPALAPYVRCYWSLTGAAAVPDEADGADPVLPDGRPELVLNLGDPARHRPVSGRPRQQPPSVLVGQITRPFAFEPGGRIDFVGVRFAPGGAFALFGMPMHEITDRYVDAGELWPAVDELTDRLVETPAPEGRASLLDAALLDRLARRRALALTIGVAARLIERASGLVSVDEVANAVGLSGRQLARRFRAEVGIGPKRLARIMRFQALLSHVTSREGASLAQVAVEYGYYDQAHLVRDFRELAGASPTAFLSQGHALADHFTEARLSREG